MKFGKTTFYDKILGCWIGKNIGGTLGAPVEWFRAIHDFTFYTHDLNGEPLPNDDLDLQLIWLKCLEDKGPTLNARDLGEYWLDYQVANYSEYGLCKGNMRAGFMPPISGTLNNKFKDSCGAYIRTEIWSCVCPGRPDLAVQYAYEDAIVDHGDGEGTYAALFVAAMESAAFVESDFNKLIKVGLSYIPEDCGVAKCINDVIKWHSEGLTWLETRDAILEHYRGRVLPYILHKCDQRDIDRDFHKGPFGYDAPSNIGIIIAGMLYGEGDFDKTLCTAVNMGEDTDCTAGTLGALFGIINGASNIPKKWIEPIGHSIQTICCNLAASTYPKTVEELTDRIINQAKVMSVFYNGKYGRQTIELSDLEDNDLSSYDFNDLLYREHFEYPPKDIMRPLHGPRYDSDFYTFALDYEKYSITPEETVIIKLLFSPKIGNYYNHAKVEWLSNDLEISPAQKQLVSLWQEEMGQIDEIEYFVKPICQKDKYEATIKISIEGRHSQIFIPVILHSSL